MKIIMLCLLTLLMCACRHGALMTQDDFSQIRTGTPIEEVEKKYGKPMSVRHDGERSIYEYFERISMGTQTVELRKYFFVVKDGKVVNKFVRYKNPPAYDEIYSDNPFPDQTG